jgi:hypothetical protein
MKININKEKYYNNPCPPITKTMWDWFYSRLYVNARDQSALTNIKKINTIDIRINQSFMNSPHIHFYISINKNKEFHMDWFDSISYDLDLFNLSKLDSNKRYRYDWIRDFIICGNIDMETLSPLERYEKRWNIIDEKEKTRKRVAHLKYQWSEYLHLKEYFNQ